MKGSLGTRTPAGAVKAGAGRTCYSVPASEQAMALKPLSLFLSLSLSLSLSHTHTHTHTHIHGGWRERKDLIAFPE